MIAIPIVLFVGFWYALGRAAHASRMADFAMTCPALYFEDEAHRRYPILWADDVFAQSEDVRLSRRRLAGEAFVCQLVAPIAFLGQVPFSNGFLWTLPESYDDARAALGLPRRTPA